MLVSFLLFVDHLAAQATFRQYEGVRIWIPVASCNYRPNAGGAHGDQTGHAAGACYSYIQTSQCPVNDRNAGFLAGCSEWAHMNALLDVLRTLRLSGGIFLDCEFSAPWCVTASAIRPEEVGLLNMAFPAHVIAHHYVTQGSMLLQMANQEPVAIGPGELVIFPTNDKHRLGTDLSIRVVNAKQLVLAPVNGSLARIEHGGGGEHTHVMCGFLGTDAPNDPIIAILPSLLKLEVPKEGSADWIEASLRFAAREQ